jgi:hypothetical protein
MPSISRRIEVLTRLSQEGDIAGDISTLLSDRVRHDLQRDSLPLPYLIDFPLETRREAHEAIVDARWMHSEEIRHIAS